MWLAGGRNDTGHGRVADDELQEELTPARGKFTGPGGQLTAAYRPEQGARLVRTVDDHGNAAILCHREKTLVRLALAEGIVDLQELCPILGYRLFQGVMGAGLVVRESTVADFSLFLEFSNTGHMDGGIAKVMHLHQVDDVCVHESGRSFHLVDPRVAPVCPDLRSEKHRITRSTVRNYVADDFFRPVIHRRAVDDAAAGAEQQVDDFTARVQLRGRALDIEHAVGAEPDHRQPFIARRDRACDHALLIGESRKGYGTQGCASAQHVAPCPAGTGHCLSPLARSLS